MTERRPVRLPGVDLTVRSAGPGRPALGGLLFPAGPISVEHPFGDTRFFRHGWNSWSPSGWTLLSEPPIRIRDSPARLLTADDAANDTPDAHSGAAVGALETGDGRVLLLGSTGLGTPRVGADLQVLRGRQEQPDGEWFLALGPEADVFDSYAEVVAERLGARTRRAGAVWSTWYSFYEAIDEGLVARTVQDLEGYPFDVVQLDDGWETAVGDWRANDRFPSGMRATARRIAGAGFRPGIWLAPFIALPGSDLARQRPDLLVQGDDGRAAPAGENWGGTYSAIDTTQPEGLAHVVGAAVQAAEAGFGYLKLDFVYAGAIAGRRHRDLPRERVYRDAIAAIRSAVGDEVYLLGSGAPMIPSAGVLDGLRTGPDVTPFWENVERATDPSGSGARTAIAASVPRAFLCRLYETDPDAVYLRSRRNLLDDEQRQLLRDLAVVLGFRSTSDPIDWLDETERAELRAFLTATPTVERTGRASWRIDGREVDFGSAIDGSYRAPDSTVAG